MKRERLFAATLIFGALVAVVCVFARQNHAFANINATRALAAFALLFAPMWFFGFGATESLRALPAWARIFAAGGLGIAYLVFALGTGDFDSRSALIIAFPVLLAAFLELAKLPAKMTWRDTVALAIIITAFFMKWFAIWTPLLSPLFSKFFLADVTLYCFLVVRNVPESGYWLVPSLSALRIGLREFVFYFPIALILGEAIGFIHFHARMPSAGSAVAGLVFTFFLVALPEELFFRTIMQNLLETRLGRMRALLIASVLFGLSHFNHGPIFNWRYVLLASIAGFFYGRAWRAKRQIFASVITHTFVDVVWSLWFR